MSDGARRDIHTTRGLGLLLPIVPGQRVAVVGRHQGPLIESLAKTGAEPLFLADDDGEGAAAVTVPVELVRPGQRLPLDDASVEPVIAVAADAAWKPVLVAELARACAPGGHAAVAAPNRLHPRTDAAAWRVDRLVTALTDGGFAPSRTYGIRQDLTDIRHMVPLRGGTLSWYARHAALAHSRRRAIAQRLLAMPTTSRLLEAVFPALVITARREGWRC